MNTPTKVIIVLLIFGLARNFLSTHAIQVLLILGFATYIGYLTLKAGGWRGVDGWKVFVASLVCGGLIVFLHMGDRTIGKMEPIVTTVQPIVPPFQLSRPAPTPIASVESSADPEQSVPTPLPTPFSGPNDLRKDREEFRQRWRDGTLFPSPSPDPIR